MKYFIVVVAFLALGITEMNAQEVVLSKREARKAAKRAAAEKKEEIAVVKAAPAAKSTPVEKSAPVVESTKRIEASKKDEAFLEENGIAVFKGEVADTPDKLFTILFLGDRVSLEIAGETIIFNKSNKTVVPYKGINAVTYTIDNMLFEGINWNEFVVYDMSGITDQEKEDLLNEKTSNNFFFHFKGAPELILMGDIIRGKF